MKKPKNHDRAPDKVGFSVALPISLVAQIEAIAEGEHRTRNGQIVHFLDEAVKRWQEEHPEKNGFVAEPQNSYGNPKSKSSIPPAKTIIT